MSSCNCLCDIFNFIFEHNSLSQVVQVLLALKDAIPYEKPYSIVLHIYFLAHASLFSIKSIVLKLGTAKKTIL